MEPMLIVVIAVLVISTVLLFAVLLGVSIPGVSSGRSSVQANLRNIVTAQRSDVMKQNVRTSKTAVKTTQITDLKKKKLNSSKITLEKKLRYARWRISPIIFHILEVAVSSIVFTVCVYKFNIVFQILSLLSGPVFMRWILNLMIDRRFRKFDADYPAFLLSVVSMLKTGMNPIQALDAAARGLDQASLVRSEVELMIERLRLGVAEDRSIGSFGEDIFHSEIELFVQALILSRRVGGTLSDTLERLSKQVRRRQYFRASAQAAVSMQRGSIWFIVAILIALEAYIFVIYPEAVVGAIKDKIGWQIWQAGILFIMAGIFWVRQVTKIRT